jgi:hypothetical protein
MFTKQHFEALAKLLNNSKAETKEATKSTRKW